LSFTAPLTDTWPQDVFEVILLPKRPLDQMWRMSKPSESFILNTSLFKLI
jgi:hypothetical protein